MQSVSSFATRIFDANISIYALVNNAAVFYAAPSLTKDNIDITFQTNYVGPFLLTILLLPALRSHSSSSRIINICSQAHRIPTEFPKLEYQNSSYTDTAQNRFEAYQYSKFYLVSFSNHLNRILENTKVSVHCVDPGNVETNIFRSFPFLSNPWLFALQKPIRLVCVKTPNEGIQTILHALLATAPPFYMINLKESNEINPRVFDQVLSNSIWTESQKLCATHLPSTI